MPKTRQTAPKKTPVKSSAHYQREFRRRLREQGLVKKEAWIIPENSKLLAHVERELRHNVAPPTIGEAATLIQEGMMSENPPIWSIDTLYEALLTTDIVASNKAAVVQLDDHTLEITLVNLGELPILLSIAGQQMLVECVMWSIEDVADVAAFDAAILRTHKYFPLSTIGIDHFGDDGDFYTLFGALSTRSLLANIVLEIETLGTNVMQAVSAYNEFLKPELRDSLKSELQDSLEPEFKTL